MRERLAVYRDAGVGTLMVTPMAWTRRGAAVAAAADRRAGRGVADRAPAGASRAAAARGRPEHAEQRVDDARVELRAGDAAQLGVRGGGRARRAPRARRGHRDERVAREQDPRGERDLLAGEAVGVAGAVEALVLVADDRRGLASSGRPRSIRSPISACSRSTARSSSRSSPGCDSSTAGTPTVPTSWNSAAR